MKNLFYPAGQCLLLLAILFSMGCTEKPGHHSVKVDTDSMTFFFSDDQAKEIIFASSQDQYQYHYATPGPEDVWQVTVPRHKEFTYFYIVDGVATLPDCPNTVLDDFGSKNCLYSNNM
ncbi:MAG: hypothetical protein M8357_04010 [Desulfobulbaceae bacterium]|nr:hypothetical protein [Desulfobulbaceae bacterium]